MFKYFMNLVTMGESRGLCMIGNLGKTAFQLRRPFWISIPGHEVGLLCWVKTMVGLNRYNLDRCTVQRTTLAIVNPVKNCLSANTVTFSCEHAVEEVALVSDNGKVTQDRFRVCRGIQR